MDLKIFFTLLASIKLKSLGRAFVGIFGFLWLFIEPLGLFKPDWFDWGAPGYAVLVLLSLIMAVVFNFPRKSISGSLSSPNSTIEIKVGDLFDESGHLVIGTNDVFDTELGDIIKSSSVQGQFLTRIYGGDQERLDAEIAEVLKRRGLNGIIDADKIKGKTTRYPLGTTLTLSSATQKYFLIAYGYLQNDLRVKSSADVLWTSLSELWEQVRLYGHGTQVAIPIVGSGLARVKLSHTVLIQLIILSFIAASKNEYVAEKLTVMVYPQDLKRVDFYKLEDFLSLVCF